MLTSPLVSRARTVLRLGVALSLGLLGAVALPDVAQAATPVTLSSQVPSSAAAALAPSFTVPSGALFVATSGSDKNPGSSTKPFATLEKALKTVKAGGTIVVRGGTYRQGIKDPAAGKDYQPHGTSYVTNLPVNVTVQNYPGETVWFDGTDVATDWTKVSSTHYTTSWSTPTFCASLYYSRSFSKQTTSGPCSHDDAIGGKSSIGNPMMAFRNGTELTEVGSLSDLKASTFYYDQSKKTIHIGFNPSGSTVELTKRAQALAVFKPVDLTIRGLGFRRYASNEYTNATGGAVLINAGSGVTLERVAATQNAGGGIQVWGSKNLTIRNSALMQNGHTGLRVDGVNGKKNDRDDMLIEYSRFDDNNLDRYSVDCQYSCSSAGAKLTHMVGVTIRFSSFSHNEGGRASGLWCDLKCTEAKIYGNQVLGNARHGLIYEVSDKGIIAGNLIADNGFGPKSGYGLMVGSANTRIYNNTIVDNSSSVFIYDDDRRPGASTGPDAVNIEFANNIVSGGSNKETPQIILKSGKSSIAGNTKPSTFMKVLEANTYYRSSADTTRWLQWKESWTDTTVSNTFYKTPADLQKARDKENGSELVVASSNPFLLSPSGNDYRTKSSAKPRALPSDIAKLLGVSSTPSYRGSLDLKSAGGLTAVAAVSLSKPVVEVSPPKAPATPSKPPATKAPSVPAKPKTVTDSFSRSAKGSWGKASTGESWSVNKTSGVGVTGKTGYLDAVRGSTRQALLKSLRLTGADTKVQVNLGTLPSKGTGTRVSILGRIVPSQGVYSAKAIVATNGITTLQVLRSDKSGKETVLKSSRLGFKVTAGKAYQIRLQVTGTKPTTIRAKVWPAGSSEPSKWNVSTTDKTAALQAAGYVGLKAYQSDSANRTTRVSFDNLTVAPK
ncbi:MAG: right-handed parallel beta-helix repeat-containing protein [Arachnia sp.]